MSNFYRSSGYYKDGIFRSSNIPYIDGKKGILLSGFESSTVYIENLEYQMNFSNFTGVDFQGLSGNNQEQFSFDLDTTGSFPPTNSGLNFTGNSVKIGSVYAPYNASRASDYAKRFTSKTGISGQGTLIVWMYFEDTVNNFIEPVLDIKTLGTTSDNERYLVINILTNKLNFIVGNKISLSLSGTTVGFDKNIPPQEGWACFGINTITGDVYYNGIKLGTTVPFTFNNVGLYPFFWTSNTVYYSKNKEIISIHFYENKSFTIQDYGLVYSYGSYKTFDGVEI